MKRGAGPSAETASVGPSVTIERVYQPDLGRQVRALVMLLERPAPEPRQGGSSAEEEALDADARRTS